MPLSDLQARVASIVASTPGAEDFALAGGAALIVSGIGSRATKDLDYFATRRDAVDSLAPAVESRLRESGLGVQVIRSSPGFVRYHVTDGADITELDLAWDHRMRAPRQSAH